MSAPKKNGLQVCLVRLIDLQPSRNWSPNNSVDGAWCVPRAGQDHRDQKRREDLSASGKKLISAFLSRLNLTFLGCQETLGLPEGERTAGSWEQVLVHPWWNHGSRLWTGEDQGFRDDEVPEATPHQAGERLMWTQLRKVVSRLIFWFTIVEPWKYICQIWFGLYFIDLVGR